MRIERSVVVLPLPDGRSGTATGYARCSALVRGLGDVASAVALGLFGLGCAVAIHHESEAPRVHRRGMAYTDAFFDGEATLDNVIARRCEVVAEFSRVLGERVSIPLVIGDLQTWLDAGHWDVVVDARMRKRDKAAPERGIASLTIGLGPGHVAGLTADIAIETQWDDRLGDVLREGATLPLAGEPRPIEGVGRERNVYAPIAGVLHSDRAIGDPVFAGDVVAMIGDVPLRAPISGTLRGLTRPGVWVLPNDKIIEVDPRPPDRAGFSGLGERPRRIADGVALAILQWTVDRGGIEK
jgi:xanthine dehydrogenase accessory factor